MLTDTRTVCAHRFENTCDGVEYHKRFHQTETANILLLYSPHSRQAAEGWWPRQSEAAGAGRLSPPRELNQRWRV